jgi:hypothetical protein
MELTPVAQALAEAEAAMDRYHQALGSELFRCLDGDLGPLIQRSHRLETRLKFATSALIAEFEDRGVAQSIGDVTTRAWLRHTLRETFAASGAMVRMATACSSKGPHPEVGQGLANGSLNWEQAQAIVRGLKKLPSKATVEDREFAKRLLLEKAADLNADDLRMLAKGINEGIDPDGTLPDEDAIETKRRVHYKDYGDGTAEMCWRDRIEHIALAKAAIGAFDAPVPQPNGAPDPRNANQRRADAMVTVLTGYLRHGQNLPKRRGQGPHLHITANLDTLKGLDGAAKAALATGGALSKAAVQALLCDAEITPIVLDAKGKPLSVGRRYRNWTAAIWDAIVARDTGCVWAGCTVPAAYCVAHHLKHWTEHQGPTEVSNGALVCPRHHVDVHSHGWIVRLDEHGIPEVIPPPWVDPDQRPRRNHHWRQQQDLLRPPQCPDRE